MTEAARIIAINVRRLRRAKGWTQTEATKRIAVIGGPTWGKANWSAMERSADGTRSCAFPADILVWLAKLFEVEVGVLFEEVLEPIQCPHCDGTGEIFPTEQSSPQGSDRG